MEMSRWGQRNKTNSLILEGCFPSVATKAACDTRLFPSALLFFLEHKQFLKNAQVELKKSKRKDYYKILGVDKNASEDEIKKAYRKRALMHHPGREMFSALSMQLTALGFSESRSKRKREFQRKHFPRLQNLPLGCIV